MRILSIEKILLAVAFVAAISSAVFVRAKLLQHASDVRASSRLQLHGSDYVRGAIDAPHDAAFPVKWPSRTERPVRDGWSFDLFSPPEISFDQEKRQFSARKRKDAVPTSIEQTENTGELAEEFLEQPPRPYRIQLTGYVGRSGDFRGIFENVATGEVLVAREGTVLEDLSITIERITVGAHTRSNSEGVIETEFLATALVRDARTSSEITLTSGVLSYLDGVEPVRVVNANEDDSVTSRDTDPRPALPTSTAPASALQLPGAQPTAAAFDETSPPSA